MLSEKQKEIRRKYIGASEVAAVFGQSPYMTAEDLRLIKAGKLEEEKPNTQMRWGIYLEPGIRRFAEDEFGCALATPDIYIHPNGVQCATLDAETPDGEPVEFKAIGIAGPIVGNWGSGGDEVPPYYLMQVMQQIACSPKKPARGWLAALLCGRGMLRYEIPRNDELIAAMEKGCIRFWTNHVLADKPAPNSLASLDVLKRVRRQPGAVMPIDPDAWREFAKLRDEAAAVEKELELAKRRVLNLAGEAEAVSVDGCVVASYTKNKKGVRSLHVKEESQTEAAA